MLVLDDVVCYDVCANDYFSALFNGDECDTVFVSDMVAPLIDPRTAAGSTGRVCPQTSVKLVPRKGITDAWHDEMSDILATNELTAITLEKLPPSLQDAALQLPNASINIVQAVQYALEREWWMEATLLYNIVRASIDLSGIYEKKDLSMIRATYFKGDKRNGPELLNWVTSFTNIDSVGEQSRLIGKVMNAKLPVNCNRDQFGTFLSNLLIDWLAVRGNDPQQPASFYHTLLRAMPENEQGNNRILWHLRSWLSDRI